MYRGTSVSIVGCLPQQADTLILWGGIDMILMQGKGMSKGVANGPIYFFQRPNATISYAIAADIEDEKVRIGEAQEKSIIQLTNLAKKAREEAGDKIAILLRYPSSGLSINIFPIV